MITLPASPATRDVKLEPIDFGVTQRPSTGAAITRIDRPGLRWAADIEWAAMQPDVARVFAARIARGVSEGLRVPFPLLGVSQAAAGSPVVTGSPAGTSLPVSGGAASATVREGWWLNVLDAAGVRYLHQMSADAILSAGGAGTLAVWPPLRCIPVGAVQFAAPVIEGKVTGWSGLGRPVGGIIRLSCRIEESA